MTYTEDEDEDVGNDLEEYQQIAVDLDDEDDLQNHNDVPGI